MKSNRIKLWMLAPPWWLRNPHVQSCLNTIFPPSVPNILLTWEELTLPDSDFIDLCWAGPEEGPIVILLHGLEGSVQSHYIQLMLDILTRSSFRVVVMHFRTCSGRLNRLARSYHAGEIGDLSYLVKVLRSRYPNQIISIVGFSLGGSVLLHYLAKYPKAPLKKAVCVSVPFDLKQCVDYTPFFYQWQLLRTMRLKAIQKIKQGLDMPVSVKEVSSIRCFEVFDNIVTAPLHGFCNVKEYYESNSVRSMLRHIEHATLIIHSEDDPLVPRTCVPTRHEISPNIRLELQAQGGHIGFIQGVSPWRLQYWLTNRIVSFLKEDE